MEGAFRLRHGRDSFVRFRAVLDQMNLRSAVSVSGLFKINSSLGAFDGNFLNPE
jgi:hypothetical protein